MIFLSILNEFFTLIHIGNVTQVESLIENEADINETENEHGYAPLHFSAGAGKLWFFLNISDYDKLTEIATFSFF